MALIAQSRVLRFPLFMSNRSCLFLCVAIFALGLTMLEAATVGHFIEAESFEDYGGWVLDTQFIEIMGSPYLMAHGLGKPVRDASTSVQNETGGKFRVWVRTKNWVGPWDAPGSPGRFQMTVSDHPMAHDFGATGKD